VVNVSRNVLTLLKVELFGKLLLKRFVLALRMPNQRSILLRVPNVSCLHLKPRLIRNSGYHGPLSTKMRGLLVHVSNIFLGDHSESRLLLVHETWHAKTSLVFTSTPAQTMNCSPFSFSLVSSTAAAVLCFRLGFGNASFILLNQSRTGFV